MFGKTLSKNFISSRVYPAVRLEDRFWKGELERYFFFSTTVFDKMEEIAEDVQAAIMAVM